MFAAGTLRASLFEAAHLQYGEVALGPGEHVLDETVQVRGLFAIRMTPATRVVWRGEGPAFAIAGGSIGTVAGGEVRGADWYTKVVPKSSGFRVGQEHLGPGDVSVSAEVMFRDLTVRGFVDPFDNQAAVGCGWQNVRTRENLWGFSAAAEHRVIDCLLQQYRSEQNRVGMRFEFGNDVEFSKCRFQANYGPGMIIGPPNDAKFAQDLRFNQTYTEGNCHYRNSPDLPAQFGDAAIWLRSEYAKPMRALVFDGLQMHEQFAAWDIRCDARTHWWLYRKPRGPDLRIIGGSPQ